MRIISKLQLYRFYLVLIDRNDKMLIAVGWLKADTKAIQAIHENVITHNPRVTVSHLDQNTWNLHIKSVSEDDRGGYMCQLNTDPMKSQSWKITRCARGYPEPIVNWRREDGGEIVLKDNAGTKTLVSSFRGEVLKLTKISRNEMGSYLCIASNGVPPSVSKRISLSIHCEMIVSSAKYHVQEHSQSMYETKMSMIVRKFQKDDVGSYRCIAKNSLGEVDSSIRLYEIPGPNRKNPSNSKGNGGAGSAAGNAGDTDANDILKLKQQVKVTYQPEDDELYGSAEDFEDGEFAGSPPLSPHHYYTSGNKPPTHKPGGSGGGHQHQHQHHHHPQQTATGGGGGSGGGADGGEELISFL
ncbi:uncharacterized protein Dmoj_GI14901 [Drosophila mojavensis]|uniref:Ig-like domain-containing protein n=1 Tax=Drosophila mojavensis TaxID=7230 RepID=A0A0Q9WZT4_DROMO|nr:uncharacterized protein Dmoj_GI14901 [Drosophila mojavensis]